MIKRIWNPPQPGIKLGRNIRKGDELPDELKDFKHPFIREVSFPEPVVETPPAPKAKK